MTSTEPNDSYPSAWRPRGLPEQRVVDDEINDYIRNFERCPAAVAAAPYSRADVTCGPTR